MAHMLLLNSGGTDSLYCAKVLHAEGHNLHSLFVFLGNTADAEASVAAQAIATAYCVDHNTMRVEGLVPVPVPIGESNIVGIPYQTLILLLLAGSVCQSYGLSRIATGAKRPIMGYADAKLADLILQSYFWKVPIQIIAPAKDMAQLAVIAALLDDPLLPLTQSCNQVPSCFESKDDRSTWCPKCVARNIYGID